MNSDQCFSSGTSWSTLSHITTSLRDRRLIVSKITLRKNINCLLKLTVGQGTDNCSLIILFYNDLDYKANNVT